MRSAQLFSLTVGVARVRFPRQSLPITPFVVCLASYNDFIQMKLTNFGSNKNSLRFYDGREVFFSYETPVAAYDPDKGYIKTNKHWSTTTTRHINYWLNLSTNAKDTPTVDQETLDEFLEVDS